MSKRNDAKPVSTDTPKDRHKIHGEIEFECKLINWTGESWFCTTHGRGVWPGEAITNNNGSREEKGTDAMPTPSDITATANPRGHLNPKDQPTEPATLRGSIRDLVVDVVWQLSDAYTKEQLTESAERDSKVQVTIDQLLALVEQEANKARVEELRWMQDMMGDPNGMSPQWKRAVRKHLEDIKGKHHD